MVDLTKNETYLDKAHSAFQAFAVGYNRGGVMTIEDSQGFSFVDITVSRFLALSVRESTKVTL
jgi:hypothetical protein